MQVLIGNEPLINVLRKQLPNLVATFLTGGKLGHNKHKRHVNTIETSRVCLPSQNSRSRRAGHELPNNNPVATVCGCHQVLSI